MAVLRDGGRFDAARGSFAAFLYGIARNHIHKRWETDRRLIPSGLGGESGCDENLAAPGNTRLSVSTEMDGTGSLRAGSRYSDGGVLRSAGVPEEFLSRETVERVRRAVGQLPESYREAVVLCDLEEMSYEEAAAALECPIGTVRSRLHRGRAMLLEKLEDAAVARRVPAAAG
jgi:RNA polymerase sigma factor (sigma-70 family)